MTKTKEQTVEGAWLLDVKVGDRVWVGRQRYSDGSGMRIETVTERTRTEIRIGRRRFRVKVYGDGSYTAFQIAAGMFADHIDALATPAECAEWDAKQEKARLANEDRERERREKEAKRDELRFLFYETTDAPLKNTNCVQITDAEWGDKYERKDRFDVVFRGLTEKQVRAFACAIPVEAWNGKGEAE